MGSQPNRFPQQERKRWGGCWGAFSCLGTKKGGKRIVPASRMPEGNASAAQPNGSQAVAGLTNQSTSLAPSLLAPPSSPASFSNSAIPSTAQSPSCFLSLSANSPGRPSSTMFATGPYAHETQLVSPPVFSTFTTEPSTAPLTPPPELAHLTTPSSPDVPFARFLTTSADLENANKNNYIAANDLQSTYSLYPGSPASSLRSPISRTSADCLSSSFPERDFPPQWDPSISPQNGKCSRSGSGRLFEHDAIGSSIGSQDTNFFCPDTFARFYLDQNPLPHAVGRLSVSKDSDVYPTSSSGHQNKQSKSPKQDVEELEAYRASFGFSADEIITTTQYVEINDVTDDSFTMTPFPIDKPAEDTELALAAKGPKAERLQENSLRDMKRKSKPDVVHWAGQHDVQVPCNGYEDHKSRRQVADVSGSGMPIDHPLTDEEDVLLKKGSSRSRKYQTGLSCSDAEIDYRRGRSLRERKGYFEFHD
ncbi:hypothetical protein F3Y22_tig00110893pilonHSYRG01403 [Hibiscus syriacus]|uniref:Hydroxyproline-rich glycoprotein family protein n=1 Tax=Hibiscus syriacus TaxID=106335 RepID=A0A6A2ZHV9_HIBSY|nr:uncharacterized protein At1g76660-like isoform X2 [Hibiscus syriacus]KAE8691177.1 hypothetical protein F3Y22_tig00110893pilonHSYRG01403 [Hibiscus syriacus]